MLIFTNKFNEANREKEIKNWKKLNLIKSRYNNKMNK